MSEQNRNLGSLLEVVEYWCVQREHADNHVTEAVELARDNGASWQQIGDYLGVSKQAAWERYGFQGACR